MNTSLTSPPPSPPPQTLTEMLEERGARYGDFKTHASITQKLKLQMMNTNSTLQ